MEFFNEYAPIIGASLITFFFSTLLYVAKKQQKQAKNNIKTA